ncbi:(2Fe-2S)-binding protein [Paenibacillus sp. CN-4]|uniref:(2Fe-2S)-binding protein n=1 Tax=Paenibacillus nanchangensis TaxID=3348343 RepID=UPI00397BE2EB
MNQELSAMLADKFDIHPEAPPNTGHSFSAASLTEPEGMKSFVEAFGPLIKAQDRKVTGAYFGGWFSALGSALQLSLSLHRTAPDFGLDNVSIHLLLSGGYCRMAFSLNRWSGADCPVSAGSEGEEAWVIGRLNCFYNETVLPLFRAISAVSGLAEHQIWGQLPARLYMVMEHTRSEGLLPEQAARLQGDYRVLKERIGGETFGRAGNPFNEPIRLIEDLADPSRFIPMRTRCCMFYLTEGGSYCYTCPRLKEEERTSRRAAFRENACSR